MSSIPTLPIKPGYRSQAADNSPESDVLQFYLLRQRTPAQRLAMAMKLIRGAKSLSLLAVKRARKNNGPEEVKKVFAQAVLAEKWLPELTPTHSHEHMWIQDSIELAKQLHLLLERLNIPYYITGGVASIAYGEPRTTRDLDLIIQIARNHIDQLVAILEQAGFYCPPGAVEEIQTGQGRVLSVTHIETILNADIVINSETPFDQSKMARRRQISLDETDTCFAWFVSPEDLVLAKLLWGRGSESEKQWRDVLGVLKVQGQALDFGYLFLWAESLAILYELEQALNQAGEGV